jgi:hypothetical protein
MSGNRQQRRQLSKNMGLKPGERLNLVGIMVQFDNGKAMHLDTTLVQIIDKASGEPLFQEVLEPIGGETLPQSVLDQQPPADMPSQEFPDDPTHAYTVQFDTPEGKMEYVKNGNFSGIRPVKE